MKHSGARSQWRIPLPATFPTSRPPLPNRFGILEGGASNLGWGISHLLRQEQTRSPSLWVIPPTLLLFTLHPRFKPKKPGSSPTRRDPPDGSASRLFSPPTARLGSQTRTRLTIRQILTPLQAAPPTGMGPPRETPPRWSNPGPVRPGGRTAQPAPQPPTPQVYSPVHGHALTPGRPPALKPGGSRR